jgi:hypothetical protein
VDLSGLGVGLHQVKPVVNLLVEQNAKLADVVITSISPAYVAVGLTELPTPTPTPSPTETPTPTQEPSTPTPTGKSATRPAATPKPPTATPTP